MVFIYIMIKIHGFRATDFNSNTNITPGSFSFIESGNVIENRGLW